MRTKQYNIKRVNRDKASDKLLLLSFFVYKYLSHHLKKLRSVDYILSWEKQFYKFSQH